MQPHLFLKAVLTLMLLTPLTASAVNIAVTGVDTVLQSLTDGDAGFTVDDSLTFATGSPQIDLTTATPWTFTKSQLNFTTLGDGEVYAEFVILMNEGGNGNSITMNEFTLSNGGSSLWDLDSGEDSQVTFNEGSINFNQGGTSAEIAIYIHHSVFTSLADTDTISTTFDFTAGTGGPDFIGFGAGDGSTPPVIPEPSAMALMMIAGLGLGFCRRRSNRRC